MFDKKKLLGIVKGFFFPKTLTCSFCRRENFNGKSVCDSCYQKLPFNDKSICDHCGRKTAYPTEYCDFCKNRQTFIDKARSAFEYKDEISKAIKKLKYDGKRYFADDFANQMKKVYIRSNIEADGIVFVPSVLSKVKERGYNQSQILAERLSEKLDIPVFYGVVEKVRETPSQVGLSIKDRMKNLRGSFVVKDKKQVKGKNILIVDDVMTTGATAEAVAEKLKGADANKVFLLTVASVGFRDKGEQKG